MDRRRSHDSQANALRRSSTGPLVSPASTSAGPAAAVTCDSEAAVETLYSHPSARITTFMNHESTGRYAPETLVPGGRVDRTLAVGPLRIYKAPGSVTFLNCGSALKPILPKSQAWCIEEDSSKFVLQIRPPQFWRIEIPVENPNHIELAAGLREVLDSILLFDKTPCPFQRPFTVELPDTPEVKRRPWRPVPKPVEALGGKLEKTTLAPAKKLPKSGSATPSALDRSRNAHTPGSSKGGSGHSTPPVTPGTSRIGEVARLTRAFDTQEEISNRLSGSGHRRQPSSASKSARRSSRTSIPPSLGLSTPDRSKSRASMYSDSGPTSPTASTTGSESLYSADWHYSSPPFSGFSSPTSGPLYDDEEIICTEELDEPPIQQLQQQQPKVRSKYPPSASKSGQGRGTEAGGAVVSTGPAGSGHRRRRSSLNQAGLRRPNLASLPPAANLLSRRQSTSGSQSRTKSSGSNSGSNSGGNNTQVLEPTNYLAKLMLRVAARITTGEWRGVVFGVNESGEKIPVQWDYTERDVSDDDDDDNDDSNDVRGSDDDLD